MTSASKVPAFIPENAVLPEGEELSCVRPAIPPVLIVGLFAWVGCGIAYGWVLFCFRYIPQFRDRLYALYLIGRIDLVGLFSLFENWLEHGKLLVQITRLGLLLYWLGVIHPKVVLRQSTPPSCLTYGAKHLSYVFAAIRVARIPMIS